MGREALPINRDLVWDYEVPETAHQSEAFRRWYIARVLTRGQMRDIQSLGLGIIHETLPHLVLPVRIRRFWEWYFDQPDVKAHYGPLDAAAA